MRNEGKGALWDIMGALRNVVEALRIVMGHYRTLRNTTEHSGTLRNIEEVLWGVAEHYGTLQKHCGLLQNVTEFLQNVTEPLQKISIMPITNWILNFAHHYNVSMRPTLTGNINPQSSH